MHAHARALMSRHRVSARAIPTCAVVLGRCLHDLITCNAFSKLMHHTTSRALHVLCMHVCILSHSAGWGIEGWLYVGMAGEA